MFLGFGHKRIPFPVPYRNAWVEDMTLHKLFYGHESETYKFFERKLTPDDIVADVGAHNGEYTNFLARRCKFVYAYEPDPLSFKKLLKSTKGTNNVKCYQNAVAEKQGVRKLGGKPGSGINSLLYGFDVFSTPVEVVTLPSEVSWAKIDVEGAEHLVLRGLSQPLNCTIEFSPKNLVQSGQDPEVFIQNITSLGYEWFALDKEGIEYKIGIKDFIKSIKGHANIYLKPI